jgi:dihydrofolate reductase
MRKVIAAFNMTLDGNCDHTAGIPDEEIHQHYADLLEGADVILYGSKTYQLMKYWQMLVQNPSGKKSMDDFALAMDKIKKIVFSFKMKNTEWDSAILAKKSIEETVMELKNAPGGNILIGSRSLIIQLMNLDLIDEFQLSIYPVIEGSGLQLFEDITNRIILKLIKAKTFTGGTITLYYEPIKN